MFPKKTTTKAATLQERAIASIHDDEESIQRFDLENFTVNLPQKHKIRATLQIEVSDEKVAKILQTRLAATRSKIIDVLSAQTYDDADKIQGKLLIKDAIRDALNDIVVQEKGGEGIVRDVYFIDFMLM